MERRIDYQIKPADLPELKTVLDVMKKKFRLTVRQIRTSKYLPEGILLNGSRVTVRHPLNAGDRLSVLLEEKVPAGALEVRQDENIDIPVSILYEDEDIVLLNKPAGVPVHPSHGHYIDTLANALCAHYLSNGETLIPRAIGRLDKDTSGVILFAKNRTAASRLSGGDAVRKTYIALVSGFMEPKVFTIDRPLKKKEGELNRMIIASDGKRAVTHGEVIRHGIIGRHENGEFVFTFNKERMEGTSSEEPASVRSACFASEEQASVRSACFASEDFACTQIEASLVRLTLETGRTHQIRVHMAHTGHPLLGDPIYNPAFDPSGCILRSALHCEKICFSHPFTGRKITVEAPLPEDFPVIPVEISGN